MKMAFSDFVGKLVSRLVAEMKVNFHFRNLRSKWGLSNHVILTLNEVKRKNLSDATFRSFGRCRSLRMTC